MACAQLTGRITAQLTRPEIEQAAVNLTENAQTGLLTTADLPYERASDLGDPGASQRAQSHRKADSAVHTKRPQSEREIDFRAERSRFRG